MVEDSPFKPPEDQPADQLPENQVEVVSSGEQEQQDEQVLADGEQPVEPQNGATNDGEPQHLGMVNHDDTNPLTPEEEQKSPDRVRNKAKAEWMAHAEDAYDHSVYEDDDGTPTTELKDRFKIEKNSLAAANAYEIQEIANRDGKTPEEVKELLTSNFVAKLNYNHSIIENMNKYGEKPKPSMVAVEALYNLVTRCPGEIEPAYTQGNNMALNIHHDKYNGDLYINIEHWGLEKDDKIIDEKWHAALFSKPLSSSYEVTAKEEDPNFDRSKTTKSREMKQEDAIRLSNLLTSFEPQ